MAIPLFSEHITADGSLSASTGHSSVQNMLLMAANGDIDAAAKVLGYLTASLYDLRQIMQNAIHECDDPHLWRCLLTYLAVGEWGVWDPFGDDETPRQRRLSWKEPQSGAAAEAITQLYLLDRDAAEKNHKSLVLLRALHGPAPIRYAAACVLGLRGDPKPLDILEDMICGGGDPATAVNEAWQLRAVDALAAIGDAACGPALLCALTSGRGPLHRAAARGLRKLGPASENVLLLALLHPDSHIRWHAARDLGQIGCTSGLDVLVEGLHDEHPAVRWATASALCGMEMAAVPFILREIVRQPLDENFRYSVYHALHGMNSSAVQERIRPLLAALRDPTAAYEAPIVAQKLLLEWKDNPQPKVRSPLDEALMLRVTV